MSTTKKRKKSKKKKTLDTKSNEIDDIFSLNKDTNVLTQSNQNNEKRSVKTIKKLTEEQELLQPRKKQKKTVSQSLHSQKNILPSGTNEVEIKGKRFDQKLGLNVYTEEALRIGQGGGTKDCPFDCQCCF
eukprot:snap_masked-scaffold_3-processed-gene-9.5-mRNA-1 protein AED:0.11 eAED:0.12 QI:0/-1/0/1/-1/1/1/0/129